MDAGSVFAPYVEQRTALLTTYRRDGTPVGTPVNVAVDGDRAFFRTWHTAGKTKRLRNNSEVMLCPSTFRGTQTGPEIRLRATLLDGERAAYASRLIERKHPLLQGILVPWAHRIRQQTTVHFELAPLDA